MNSADLTRSQSGVYLLHFDMPYKHCLHYLGWSIDIDARIMKHWRKPDVSLIKAARDCGITWDCVRVWTNGNRYLERRLRNYKHNSRLCPVCNPHGRLGSAKYVPAPERYDMRVLAAQARLMHAPF